MKRLALSVLVICVCASTSLAQAQDTRMVDVDGHQMHALTIGLENADSGSPVVVFEAGGGQSLTTWDSVFEDVAEFAAAVAYDRAGLGGSEPDGQLQTPRHVAENLHALLEEVGAEPPYVLVGHSFGGLVIRMFTGMYPEDVAGLVYVDPATMVTEEQQRALDESRGLSADLFQQGRERMRQRELSPQLTVINELMVTHYAEFHALPPVPDVPISVLMAGKINRRAFGPPVGDLARTCEPTVCHAQWQKVKMEVASALVRDVTNGTFIHVTNSGHFIQREDPDLVVWAIRRVVDASPPQRRP